jgi:hypothetical protein
VVVVAMIVPSLLLKFRPKISHRCSFIEMRRESAMKQI